MFDFEETIWGASDKGWYDCKQITPDAYKKCCFTTQRKIGDIGFVSNIIENHDEPRGVSRYIPEDAWRSELYASRTSVCLPGPGTRYGECEV